MFNNHRTSGAHRETTFPINSIQQIWRENPQKKSSDSCPWHRWSHRVTIESESNDPTICNGYGRQQPKISDNLNDLNLPTNSFNTPATIAVVPTKAKQHIDKENPQWLVPSELSSIPKPLMAINLVNLLDTPSDVGTFYPDERRKTSLSSSTSPKPPLRQQNRKLNLKMSIPKRRGV